MQYRLDASRSLEVRSGSQAVGTRSGERMAEREPDIALAAGVGELMASTRGIRAGQKLPVQRLLRQLVEREIQQSEMSSALFAPAFPGRRISSRISRPQDTISGLNPNPR